LKESHTNSRGQKKI